MNNMKHKIFSLLVLLLTAATGAWAQEEVLLTYVTATTQTTSSQTPDGVVTVSLNGIGYCDANYGWLNSGSVTVEAAQGYTITQCIFWSYDGTPLTDNMAPFTATIVDGGEGPSYVSTGQAVSYMDGIKYIEVYGTAAPAIEVTPVEGKTNEWEFDMPASDVELTPIYSAATIYSGETETPFETLNEAFAAVKDGDVIKLDWNVTVTEQLQTPITDGGVRFTLDFNGYTLDGTALVYAISLNNNGDRMTFIDSTEGEMGGLKGSITCVENAIAIFTSGRANAGYSAETLNYFCSKTEMTGLALADGKEFVDLEGGADANDGFTVRLAWKAFDFAIEAGRFTTFYADKNIALDESLAEGIEIYTITAIDTDRSTATLSALYGTIAAGTPMLVYNSNEDDKVVKFLVTDEAASDAVAAVPEFKGTAVDLEFTADDMEAADYYALSGGKAFAKVKGAGTIAKNQCWLQFDKEQTPGARTITFIFDDETTKIGHTDFTDSTDKAWYTIDGRKIAAPTKKGIYILNGKKVVIK